MLLLRNTLQQFLRDLRTQKLRAFLTLFGIVWGTAAVTLLLAFGKGFQQRIEVSFKGLGEDIVICWPATTSKPWNGLPKGRPIRVTEDDIAQLRLDVPEIAAVSGEYAELDQKFRVGRKVVVPGYVGTNPIFAVMRNMIPAAGGRFLDALDMAQRRRVVFLGDKLKGDLFGEADAVGHSVVIGGTPFLVVGVMQAKDQDSNYNGRDSDKAVVPDTTYRALYGNTHVDDFVFQVRRPGEAEAAKKKVLATLARIHRFDPTDEEAIGMWDTTENMRFLHTFFLGFRVFLGVVGALTLVVGGIGVSNIMNVVVEERTKEIGVKMALGARRRFIVGQFLLETALLTALGGGLGFLVSWAICAGFPALHLESFVGTPRVSLDVAAITTGILGVIGFVAGFFPARTAASLNPVEALRL